MAAGRTFRREFATDAGGAFLVNEETARLMGLKPQDAVGKCPSISRAIRGPIIGVTKNYHYSPVANPLEPMAVVVRPSCCSIRHHPLGQGRHAGSPETGRKGLAERQSPVIRSNINFSTMIMPQSYSQYEQMGTLLRWFSALAVVVACLGLFGLASFLAEQRRKEIGVRKVLGASEGQVIRLLTKEFAKWVLLANLVAWPAAYFAARSWLGSSPTRTNIPPVLFVLAGAAALAIAVLTVSGQAWKALA